MRMEKHITLAGAFNLGLGILGILVVIGVSILLGILGPIVEDPEAIGIVAVIMTGVLLLIAIVSAAQIIGGIGLLKRQAWSRILLLVVSALRLIDVPLGTALGIYTIWVLIHDDTKRLLEARSPVQS
jgi:hypothetical protein